MAEQAIATFKLNEGAAIEAEHLSPRVGADSLSAMHEQLTATLLRDDKDPLESQPNSMTQEQRIVSVEELACIIVRCQVEDSLRKIYATLRAVPDGYSLTRLPCHTEPQSGDVTPQDLCGTLYMQEIPVDKDFGAHESCELSRGFKAEKVPFIHKQLATALEEANSSPRRPLMHEQLATALEEANSSPRRPLMHEQLATALEEANSSPRGPLMHEQLATALEEANSSPRRPLMHEQLATALEEANSSPRRPLMHEQLATALEEANSSPRRPLMHEQLATALEKANSSPRRPLMHEQLATALEEANSSPRRPLMHKQLATAFEEANTLSNEAKELIGEVENHIVADDIHDLNSRLQEDEIEWPPSEPFACLHQELNKVLSSCEDRPANPVAMYGETGQRESVQRESLYSLHEQMDTCRSVDPSEAESLHSLSLKFLGKEKQSSLEENRSSERMQVSPNASSSISLMAPPTVTGKINSNLVEKSKEGEMHFVW